MKSRRRIGFIAFALLLGCADLGNDPDVPVAIEFDGIAFPSVITGDTLRDSLGVATPLQGRAYNSSGDVIAGAAFQYFTSDTGVTISSSGILRATRRDGPVRLIASAGGLQSIARTIRVTRRPDTVSASGSAAITFNYALPDAATNLAPELKISLRSTDTAGVGPNVGGWLVRWRTVHAGDTLAAGDTTLIALQSSTGRRATLDTTGTDGTSARRLRVFSGRLTVPTDSFIVLAEVKRYGVPVPGSPVRFVVTVAPPPP